MTQEYSEIWDFVFGPNKDLNKGNSMASADPFGTYEGQVIGFYNKLETGSGIHGVLGMHFDTDLFSKLIMPLI